MKTLNIYLTILLFCNLSISVTAYGTTPIDSLRHALADAKDTDRPAALYEIFKAFAYTNLDYALYYANLSLQSAIGQQDSLGMALAYRARGSMQMQKGEVEMGIVDMEQGLAIAQQHPSLDESIAFFLLNDLGVAYLSIPRLDRAIEYFFQYLIEAENRDDKKSISICLNNIGIVYYKLDDYKSALTYYERAYTINKEIDNTDVTLQETLINIAECYNKLGERNHTVQILQKILANCADGQCAPNVIAEAHITIGETYLNIEDHIRIKNHLEKGLALAHSSGISNYECKALRLLGEFELGHNKPSTAIALLDRAQSIAKTNNLRIERMKNHKLYALSYSMLGQYAESSNHWRLYDNWRSSIFRNALIQNIAQAQIHYEQRGNLDKLVVQKKMISLHEETIKNGEEHAEIITVATITIFATLLVVGWMYYRKRQINADLDTQNVKLEKNKSALERTAKERTKKLNIANKMLDRINKEMKHLMYKISHDLRGPIATIRGLCGLGLMELKEQTALKYFKMTDDTANMLDSILTRIQRTIDINNAEISMESINLMEFARLSWKTTLKNRTVERDEEIPKNMKISYSIEDKVNINSNQEMLGVILENILDNTVKFRNPTNHIRNFVNVVALDRKNYTEIKVIDNGIGIPEDMREKAFQLFVRINDSTPNTGGMGLYLASTAAQRIGATIKLGVTKEGHTELTLKIPKNFVPPKSKKIRGHKIATWMSQSKE